LARTTLAVLSLALVLLLAATNILHAAPAEKSVRVIYLVPKDGEHRKDYQAAIEAGVLDLQVWYYGHVGKTFRLNRPIVEVKQTDHDSAWYDAHEPANKPGQKFHTFYNALEDAQRYFGAKPGDPDFVWMIYVDAPGGTGAGFTGVTILPKHDLEGLIGKAPDKTPISRWFGGAGHELGHAFGRPHPGDAHPQAIMQLGYITYPACYLTPDDIRALDASPFFHADRPDTFQGRGRFVYRYNGGYFVKADGAKWEERKTGSDEILRFTQQAGEADYVYLLDASRKPGAWVALPKEGKGSEIRFRWQGEEWKKLYEAKE